MNKEECHILFICTGNLCRSPMAEGILKKKLEERGITHIHVRSAGMMAQAGYPATSLTQDVSGSHQVDLSSHQSRFVTASLVSRADIILVMEHAHKRDVENWFHPNQGKVFLLRAFGTGGEAEEIDDPIGGTREVFEFCFQAIEREIDRILPQINQFCES